MKTNILTITLYLILISGLLKCANPMAPTGGEKDTIPPIALTFYPLNQSTNFTGKEIIITFNENIAADKLKQSLLLSPAIELKYSHLVKKNILTIKLERPLEDSTTYTFNFLDGVTDITEKNPASNLILAFSTGDFIDSLSINGTVKNAITNLVTKDTKVALYPASDTLDIFTQKPKYIVSADNESGQYKFSNIKSAKYRILAFHDENKNQQLESGKEQHGFIEDTINLLSDIDSLNIYTVLQDISPLNLISARPFGKYFDIRLNKEISNYDLKRTDSSELYIPSMLNTEKNTIKVINYNKLSIKDSLRIIINVSDTIKQNYTDTLYVKFTESNKKTEELKITSLLEDNTIVNYWNPKFTFNKPIKIFDKSKVRIVADTTINYQLEEYQSININKNKLIIDLNAYIDWVAFSDSLYKYEISNLADTINKSDSANYPKYKVQNITTIKFDKGAFISYENDTLPLKTIVLKKADDKLLGKLNVRLKTDEKSFRLVLLNKDGNTEHQFWNQKNIEIKLLKPGSYGIRVYIDKDGDGLWSSGNMLKNKKPEPVYNYPQMTEIKANWEIDINDVSF